MPLDLAIKVRLQDQRQRGQKVYSLHASEVECIGKGKARAPYEFGCEVSVATPVTQPKGGQFVLHVKALHGNLFDGHTLGPMVADMERLIGITARRIHVDKGYRGHNHPNKFRVWISGQVRRTTAALRREMNDVPPLSRSSAMSKLNTGWHATTSRAGTAVASMPSLPPPVTISACSALAPSAFARPHGGTHTHRPATPTRVKYELLSILHERLSIRPKLQQDLDLEALRRELADVVARSGAASAAPSGP